VELPDDGVREWRRSVPKMLLTLLGVVPFVTLGAYMVIKYMVLEPARGDEIAIGCVVVLLFVIQVYRWVRPLLARDPVVIRVGPAGFHDRRLTSEPIPWEDIDGFSRRRLRGQGLLVLRMTREGRRRHMRSGSMSWSARLDVWMRAGPSSETRGLTPSFDDLVAAVSERSRKNRRRTAESARSAARQASRSPGSTAQAPRMEGSPGSPTRSGTA